MTYNVLLARFSRVAGAFSPSLAMRLVTFTSPAKRMISSGRYHNELAIRHNVFRRHVGKTIIRFAGPRMNEAEDAPVAHRSPNRFPRSH